GARWRAAARDVLSVRRQPRDVHAHRQLQDRPGPRPRHPGAAGAMTVAGYTLAASPLLPWWAIAAFAGIAVLALFFGIVRRARGTAWRLLATAVLLAILTDPSLLQEDRLPQRDVAAVVVDDSPSMRIGDRRHYAQEALDQISEKLKAFQDLDVRIVRAGG